MTETKPLPLTHSDTIILQALLENASGSGLFDEMMGRIYTQLVTMEQEFRAESGVLQ